VTWRATLSRRRYVLPTLALFSLLAAVFFTQEPIEARERPWRGPHLSEDGWYYYHYLRSAVLDGDLELDDDYRELGNWYGFGYTATGARHNPFGIGPALFWTPGFLVGHAIEKVWPSQRGSTYLEGATRAEQGATLFTSFVAALLAFWFAFRWCARYVAEHWAFAASLLAFFGSPLVWYALYSPAMPHALEACLASALLLQVEPPRERSVKQSAWLGATAGALALVRPQHAVFLAVPALQVVVELWRGDTATRWRVVRSFAVLAGVALLVFSPQLWLWKRMYGSAWVVPQGSGFLRFGASLASETLFSSRNGLFTSTPLLWFVLPGLVLAFRRDRVLGAVLAGLFFTTAFVNGAVWDWWGGGAFGGRRFLATYPVWVLSFAVLLDALARSRRLRRAGLGLACGVGFAGLVLQLGVLRAHKAHAFSWETTVPFGERVRIATGLRLFEGRASPFSFPANAWFALRHGVPASRYDRSVGPYLLDERLPTTNPLLPPKKHDRVSFMEPGSLAFLGRGFELRSDGAEAAGGQGELFVPLNRSGRLVARVELTAQAEAPVFRWNGVVVPTVARSTSFELSVDAASVERGINVLGVEAAAPVVVRALELDEGADWPPDWAKVYPTRSTDVALAH